MNRNIYIHGQEVYKKLACEYKICITKTNVDPSISSSWL